MVNWVFMDKLVPITKNSANYFFVTKQVFFTERQKGILIKCLLLILFDKNENIKKEKKSI